MSPLLYFGPNNLLLWGIVLLPLLGAFVLLLIEYFGVHLSEKLVGRICQLTMVAHLLLILSATVALGLSGRTSLIADLGNWYHSGHYAFPVKLFCDYISCPILLVTSFLLNVIGYFSIRYLHRDPGFQRFFLLYLLFACGISLVISAGTVDLLFAGWEILGLSSALLIGFYQLRKAPVQNSLYTFINYRCCDVALLGAAVVWHHFSHTADIPMGFADLASVSRWQLSPGQLSTVGVLFVLASLAKSAQLPMSSWLPKAMEGPTPSSAIFYGALSIHAGAYLLLRTAPIFEHSLVVKSLIVVIGLSSAFYAAIVGRTRSDVKTLLAFAAMAQVGIIYVEIGFGLYHLALAHLIGHALIRSLQILRSPNILHDMQQMGHEPVFIPHAHFENLLPQKWRVLVYRIALAEGHLETVLVRGFVHPILAFVNFIARVESWCLSWSSKKGAAR